MSIRFCKATMQQFQEMSELYQSAVADMRARGLRQWEWGSYPNESLLEQDIEQNVLYRAEEDGHLSAVFVVSDAMEDPYAQLSWQYGVKPVTLHRFAMRPDCFGTELVSRVLAFVKQEGARRGYDCLRLDTCREDEHMLHLFRRETEREVGEFVLDNPEGSFVCFESPLKSSCPMLPIRMCPAYRYGEMTPWGGDGLRRVYHKRIPDERTGEALEISAIPKLESTTVVGETLTQLISRDSKRLTGLKAGESFPLLLKLLAAREPLSVQVHPNDAYASEHEGKLGKSEAWVILNAEKGASILYGIRDGVTVAQMRQALNAGEDIAPMIECVPVQAGDVFYMPSGMVHAIGGGIVLYEIQQSSDVTYRLWDYNRTNAAGEKRPLHLKQALDVIDDRLRGERTQLPKSGGNEVVHLLNVPAFALDCACVNGELALPPSEGRFRMLTALAGLLLSWQGDALEMEAGDSVLLPASCPPATLMGVGRALLSTP